MVQTTWNFTVAFLFAVGVFASGATDVQVLCPVGFLRLGHSCYYFSADMLSWQQAYFDCRDKGSTLVIIESLWEDNMLRRYLNKPQLARLNRWIGGEYNWITFHWIWGPTGQEMDYTGFLTDDPPSATRWQCVYMSPSLFYRWNHASCMTDMHYICKAPQVRPLSGDNSDES